MDQKFAAFFQSLPPAWKHGIWTAMDGGVWKGSIDPIDSKDHGCAVFFVHPSLAGLILDAISNYKLLSRLIEVCVERDKDRVIDCWGCHRMEGHSDDCPVAKAMSLVERRENFDELFGVFKNDDNLIKAYDQATPEQKRHMAVRMSISISILGERLHRLIQSSDASEKAS